MLHTRGLYHPTHRPFPVTPAKAAARGRNSVPSTESFMFKFLFLVLGMAALVGLVLSSELSPQETCVMPSSLITQPAKPVHRFVVGRDGEGHWIARDEQGLTGGVFSDRTAAIHFAETESDHQPGAVRLAPAAIRLSLFN